MKFEITKKVKTPDGVEHDSIEAARQHMWGANLDILAGASRGELEEAIAWQGETEEMPADVLALRHALREVFLAAWPRASKGQPRKPREAASEAPKGGEGQPSDDATQGYSEGDEGVSGGTRMVADGVSGAVIEQPAPTTAPKRNHGKKAA